MYWLGLGLAFYLSLAMAAEHPVLPVGVSPDREQSLRAALAPLLALSEEAMLRLIPEQSGLYFVGCARCQGGQQEGQLSVWEVRRPDVVKCAYCGQEYPSPDFPTTGVLEVKTPAGTIARYPYYEGRPSWWHGREPYRFYFQARVDYHQLRYMERAALQLAQLYALTKDPAIGRRAALVLARFAEVYPRYCYHFDYPFRQKIIYEGEVSPRDFLPGFRTARWTWWAYGDLSAALVQAYDLLAGSQELEKLSAERGRDVAAEIRRMLTMMAEQVLANKDELTNMSPSMWRNVILAGRVLQQPAWIHECVGRLREMLRTQFFYDGAWLEGAPSYHSQTIGTLEGVFEAARGYSDPPGYQFPQTGERFDDLDLKKALPEAQRAWEALDRLRLPDGRLVPVHDTWWTNRRAPREESQPDLLPGLGHAILGYGKGAEQFQAHLTYSPGLGHQHWDGLSLLLFAYGKELLSDIGYTHTKWREWTIHSAAHNLVVVEGLSQKADKFTLGHLRYFTAGPAVQAVSVDNPQVYPGVTEHYRRTLVLVRLSPTAAYLADFFAVIGGQQHDYFLHGSADEAQQLTAEGVALMPSPTLLPPAVAFRAAQSEADVNLDPWHAYGYLRDLQAGSPRPGVVRLDFAPRQPGAGLQAFVVTEPHDELVLGRGPAIRQAQDDDAKLEQYWRAFALLRRRGPRSLFTTILAPHGGTPLPLVVRRLSWPGVGMALEIASATRTDLLLYDASEPLEQSWQGQKLRVHAALAVLGIGEGRPLAACVVGGQLAWGSFALKTESPVASAALKDVQTAPEPKLIVTGAFPAAPGAVVTLDHAGRYTTAYTIRAVRPQGDRTELVVAERPGFVWDATTATSAFFTIPRERFTGPHQVRLIAAAHFARE